MDAAPEPSEKPSSKPGLRRGPAYNRRQANRKEKVTNTSLQTNFEKAIGSPTDYGITVVGASFATTAPLSLITVPEFVRRVFRHLKSTAPRALMTSFTEVAQLAYIRVMLMLCQARIVSSHKRLKATALQPPAMEKYWLTDEEMTRLQACCSVLPHPLALLLSSIGRYDGMTPVVPSGPNGTTDLMHHAFPHGFKSANEQQLRDVPDSVVEWVQGTDRVDNRVLFTQIAAPGDMIGGYLSPPDLASFELLNNAIHLNLATLMTEFSLTADTGSVMQAIRLKALPAYRNRDRVNGSLTIQKHL